MFKSQNFDWVIGRRRKKKTIMETMSAKTKVVQDGMRELHCIISATVTWDSSATRHFIASHNKHTNTHTKMQNEHRNKYVVERDPCAAVTWEPRSALRPFIAFRVQFPKQVGLDAFGFYRCYTTYVGNSLRHVTWDVRRFQNLVCLWSAPSVHWRNHPFIRRQLQQWPS